MQPKRALTNQSTACARDERTKGGGGAIADRKKRRHTGRVEACARVLNVCPLAYVEPELKGLPHVHPLAVLVAVREAQRLLGVAQAEPALHHEELERCRLAEILFI